MKIIDRYIIKEFLTPFCYCFFAFLLLFIVGDLFENLDTFLSQKMPWMVVVKYYLFMAPNVFVLTAPLAVLLPILYQLGYMAKHSEITALKASGVSFWRIIFPFCMLGILLSILLFVINEELVPHCAQGTDYIRESYGKKKEVELPDKQNSEIYKNITFFSSLHNLSFYIDELSVKKNEGQGISIREFYKDGTLKKEWYGNSGAWKDSSWWIFDGYVRQYEPAKQTGTKTTFFKKQEVPINIQPKDLVQSQQDISVIANYMSFGELLRYIKRNFTSSTVPRELMVDLYRKLSIPFTLLIVVIFGVTFGAKISRGGALASVGLSLGFYLAYYGISSFLLAMGKLGKIIPSLAVWTPHIIFGIISIKLLRQTK